MESCDLVFCDNSVFCEESAEICFCDCPGEIANPDAMV